MSNLLSRLQVALDAHGGNLPFDEFMRIALHDPEGGYYATNIRGIGAQGDFTTAPKLSSELAEAIANWIRREIKRLDWKRCSIIECGPGDGTLARQVMKSFGWLERRRIHLHLVETSSSLRKLQKKTLSRFRPRWHEDIQTALAACDGRALIFHNEFLDAFPCRVFQLNSDDNWSELYLKVQDRKLVETLLPPRRPLPVSTAFQHPWQIGQRIEVFESVNQWMQSLAATWHAGSMLTIDYGAPLEILYDRRLHGSLRAYRNQECLTGVAVFELPGHQDITADINFSDLAIWGKELGLQLLHEESLTDFTHPADPHLAAASQAFRCLSLTKNP